MHCSHVADFSRSAVSIERDLIKNCEICPKCVRLCHTTSLVSRLFPPPAFDHLQFLHTASDQKLEVGMAWKWGWLNAAHNSWLVKTNQGLAWFTGGLDEGRVLSLQTNERYWVADKTEMSIKVAWYLCVHVYECEMTHKCVCLTHKLETWEVWCWADTC